MDRTWRLKSPKVDVLSYIRTSIILDANVLGHPRILLSRFKLLILLFCRQEAFGRESSTHGFRSARFMLLHNSSFLFTRLGFFVTIVIIILHGVVIFVGIIKH